MCASFSMFVPDDVVAVRGLSTTMRRSSVLTARRSSGDGDAAVALLEDYAPLLLEDAAGAAADDDGDVDVDADADAEAMGGDSFDEGAGSYVPPDDTSLMERSLPLGTTAADLHTPSPASGSDRAAGGGGASMTTSLLGEGATRVR
jgi:hypothetical protein